MASDTFTLVRQLLIGLPKGKEFVTIDRRIYRLSLRLVRERSSELPKKQRPNDAWIRMTAKSNLLRTAKGKLIGGNWKQEDYRNSSALEIALHKAYQTRFALLALHNLEVIS